LSGEDEEEEEEEEEEDWWLQDQVATSSHLVKISKYLILFLFYSTKIFQELFLCFSRNIFMFRQRKNFHQKQKLFPTKTCFLKKAVKKWGLLFFGFSMLF
jgi:hypothetical protein